MPALRRDEAGRGDLARPAYEERAHGSSRNSHLKRRYGIDDAETAWRIDEQGGMCLICMRAPAAHVDHDHATGEIRGMLCFNCNGGLDQFKDDVWAMRRAIDYLGGTLARPCRTDDGGVELRQAPAGDGDFRIEWIKHDERLLAYEVESLHAPSG